jgi:hypothetical protein
VHQVGTPRHLRNLCFPGFEPTKLMQTVRKYLVYEYVPIMEKTFRSGTRESCVAQQSIYVVMRGNEETRSYISQVRNVLRHMIIDIMDEFTAIQGTQFSKLFSLLTFLLALSKREKRRPF